MAGAVWKIGGRVLSVRNAHSRPDVVLPGGWNSLLRQYQALTKSEGTMSPSPLRLQLQFWHLLLLSQESRRLGGRRLERDCLPLFPETRITG